MVFLITHGVLPRNWLFSLFFFSLWLSTPVPVSPVSNIRMPTCPHKSDLGPTAGQDHALIPLKDTSPYKSPNFKVLCPKTKFYEWGLLSNTLVKFPICCN